VYTIIEGAANSDLAGKLMALHGCRVSCGAQVLAVQQHHATHENDAGELPALERAIARSEAERAAVAGVVANTSAKTTLAQADRVTEAVTEPRTPLCEGCLKKASQQGSFFLMV
jgi:hypothetical protein